MHNLVLTEARAKLAVARVMPTILKMMEKPDVLKRKYLHIVVGNPDFIAHPGVNRDVWTQGGGVLYEESIGEKETWPAPFDIIARTKAFMSWRTGRSTREIHQSYPMLLRPGDTVFYGSAVDPVSRLAIGVSGVQPYYDECFAKMILAMCQAICFQAQDLQKLPAPDGIFYIEDLSD